MFKLPGPWVEHSRDGGKVSFDSDRLRSGFLSVQGDNDVASFKGLTMVSYQPYFVY